MRVAVHLCVFSIVLCPITMATTIHVPREYNTIQDAIYASQDGDTILVAPGTYLEKFDIFHDNFAIRSEQGPEVTIIDGSMDADMVVEIFNHDNIVLDGFTFQGGSGHYYSVTEYWYPYTTYYYCRGGALFFYGTEGTVVRNCIIRDNSVNGTGKTVRRYLRQGPGSGLGKMICVLHAPKMEKFCILFFSPGPRVAG